jgi:hypothetical protein
MAFSRFKRGQARLMSRLLSWPRQGFNPAIGWTPHLSPRPPALFLDDTQRVMKIPQNRSSMPVGAPVDLPFRVVSFVYLVNETLQCVEGFAEFGAPHYPKLEGVVALHDLRIYARPFDGCCLAHFKCTGPAARAIGSRAGGCGRFRLSRKGFDMR